MITRYPSKTARKIVEENTNAKIIRQIAHGKLEMAARNVMNQKEMKETILKEVERNIQAECTALCSRKSPSIFSKVSSDDLMQLTNTAIVEELQERAPILSRCVKATTRSKRSMAENEKAKKGEKYKRIPAISLAVSILLRSRCSYMSANSYRMSTILWHSGVDKKVCTFTLLLKSVPQQKILFYLKDYEKFSWLLFIFLLYLLVYICIPFNNSKI